MSKKFGKNRENSLENLYIRDKTNENITNFKSIDYLHGVPIENCQKLMDVELKRYTFDHMLVKPKSVRGAMNFFNL